MSTTEGGRPESWIFSGVCAAEERRHLVAHDAQDGLVGAEALQDVLADGLLADALEELLDHPEVHVGLEQGEADLAQRRVHVGLGQRCPAHAATGRFPVVFRSAIRTRTPPFVPAGSLTKR